VLEHVVLGQLNKQIAADLNAAEKPSKSIAPRHGKDERAIRGRTLLGRASGIIPK
jgi:FixJ family two-component response regulator